MRILREILFSKNFRKELFLLILTAILLATVPFIFVFYFIPVKSHLFEVLFNIGEQTTKGFIKPLLEVTLCLFLTQSLHFLGSMFLGKALGNINGKVKEIMFRKAQSLPSSYFFDNNAGSSEKYITKSSEDVCETIYLFFMNAYPEFCAICMCVVRSFKFSPQIGYLTVVWSLVMMTLLILFTKIPQKFTIESFKFREKQSGFIVDNLKNILLEKIFRSQSQSLQIFRENQIKDDTAYKSSIIYNGLNKFLLGNINAVFFAVFLVLVKFLPLEKDSGGYYLTIAETGLCILTDIWLLIVHFLPLVLLIGKFKAADHFLSLKEEERSLTLPVINEINRVEIRNFSFSYGTKEVFKNFSCVFSNGLNIIEGNSGSGKSTLIRSILGLEKVSDDSIFLNGKDINSYNKDSILDSVAYLTQSDCFFNNTVEFNIKLGNQEASKEEFVEVVEAARVTDFLGHDIQNYNVKTGVACSLWSGGQAKRFSIARMLLKNKNGKSKKMIVLDEPFSNLNIELIQEIKKIIKQLVTSGSIVICIEHSNYLDDIAIQKINLNNLSR